MNLSGIDASIVVLTHNNLSYTKRCIDSVLRNTTDVSFELIIVDNASSDDTPKYLETLERDLSNIRILPQSKNTGFARGNNLGLNASQGTHLVLLNNDVIVTEGWLGRLIHHLQDPTIGLVGPVTNSCGNEAKIFVTYENIDGIQKFADKYTKANAGQLFDIPMLAMFCVALRKSVYTEVGELDEGYGIGMFEDDDYSIRVHEADYRTVCVEDVFIHHEGGISFKCLQRAEYWDLFDRNRMYFEKKWGRIWTPPRYRNDLIDDQLLEQFINIEWLSKETIRLEHALRSETQRLTIALNKNVYNLGKVQQLLNESQAKVVNTDQLNAALCNAVNERDLRISDLNETLQQIYKTRGWRILNRIRGMRFIIVPYRSKREKIFNYCIRSAGKAFRKVVSLSEKTVAFANGRKEVLTEVNCTDQLRAHIPLSNDGESIFVKERSILDTTRYETELTKTFAHSSIPLVANTVSIGTDKTSPSRLYQPLVSVILPVYNHADMLEGAAQSVLNSTYKNIELIIIDDGSTDEIDQVLKRLVEDDRIKILRQENQKLPRALTHAHQHTAGDFITWTSADNFYLPNAIKLMVEALLANPDTSLVYADVSLIDGQGNPVLDKSYRPQNLDKSDESVMRLYQSSEPLGLEADNYINACFLYRTEASNALNQLYADDLLGLEDYDFWLRLQRTGKLRHIGNESPLYQYRVHERTMSHELLTEQRDAHLNRLRQFIEFEQERDKFARKKWTLVLDDSLSLIQKKRIQQVAESAPVDILTKDIEHDAKGKRVRIVSPGTIISDNIVIKFEKDVWNIEWKIENKNSGISTKSLRTWNGTYLLPLIKKARRWVPNRSALPITFAGSVVGCLLPNGDSQLDLDLTEQLVRINTDILFVFISNPENQITGHNNVLTDELLGLPNLAIINGENIESNYPLLAHFKAILIPPLSSYEQESYCQQCLAFSYSCGVPLVVPKCAKIMPGPYQYTYNELSDSLSFVADFERDDWNLNLMDKYLESFAPDKRLMQVLSYVNAIAVDQVVPRPDFKVNPPLKQTPFFVPNKKRSVELKIGLAINKLDKGGLENVVALLARNLTRHKLDVFILCFESGGSVADSLYEENHRVYIANKDKDAIRRVLIHEEPDVINTHFVDETVLLEADKLGIPVVETIHNTYVWFDEKLWQSERRKSQHYAHAIAVSELVKDYYIKWNGSIKKNEKVSVIPNAISTKGRIYPTYNEARKKLGYQAREILFVCLGSYDARKNQLGLVHAFDKVANEYGECRLLCAGNIVDTLSFERLRDYTDTLLSRENISIQEFREDTDTLLSAADVFVINSFFEGWSLAATESLMAGTPLIHTECGSAHELVGADGERGKIVPNPVCSPLDLDLEKMNAKLHMTDFANTSDLTQAIRDMVKEIEIWRRRREQIREYALTAFEPQKMMKDYKTVFATIAKNSEQELDSGRTEA